MSHSEVTRVGIRGAPFGDRHECVENESQRASAGRGVRAGEARGELTLTRAAELMGLGYRLALRSDARYQQLGDRRVVH